MSNTTSTVNETGSSNNTSSSNSSIASSVKEEVAEDNSPASVMPYWRANREPSLEESREKSKEYQPRPAKYKENYEDKGIKVFKPDFDVVGTITTDTFAKLEDPNKQKKKETA